MKITRIVVYQVDLPLTKPYRLSGGRLLCEQLDTTIVSLETDDGLVGWGESCPWGATYLPAFAGGVRAGIAELAPALLGRDPRELDRINHVLDTALPGHLYIKSALDMACWDLLGKHVKLPLHILLGGDFGPVTLQSSISTGTPDEMVEAVRAARGQGYSVYTVKIGVGVRGDIERIESLLSDLRPGESLTFDVNRAWLPDQAIVVMNSTSDLRPYFEQPCETIEACRVVRGLTRHPIILDESIHTFEDLIRAQTGGVAQAIGLKVGRVGGLTKARRMRDFCVATGVRMNIEDTGGSTIADAAAVHLASSTPTTHRRATWLSSVHHTVATATGGFTATGGEAVPVHEPGLGIEPDAAVLGAPVAAYT